MLKGGDNVTSNRRERGARGPLITVDPAEAPRG